jgi:hypothetical protein
MNLFGINVMWQIEEEWRFSPTMDENYCAIVTKDGFTIAPPMNAQVAKYLVRLHNEQLSPKASYPTLEVDDSNFINKEEVTQ